MIPLQRLEMVWPFRNGQLFLLAILIPHKFDIGRQVCFVAFKCNSCNTYLGVIFDEFLTFEKCAKTLSDSAGRSLSADISKFKRFRNIGF